MELVAAVAIGLNPFVSTLFLAALLAFTHRLPGTAVLAAVPDAARYATVVLFALAMPIELLLSKFPRFAPATRRVTHVVAPVSAALFAAGVTHADIPLPLVAAGSAALAWGVSVAVTAIAVRASRAANWVGLGHTAVLMVTATAAACLLPFGIVKAPVGGVLAALALVALAWAVFAGRAAPQQTAAPRRRVHHAAIRRAAGR